MGNKTRINSLYVYLLAAGLMVLASIDPAHAGDAPQKLSDVIDNAVLSMVDIRFFISIVAYISGIAFAVSGVIKLRDHVDDPGKTTLGAGLGRLLAAALLSSFPTAVVILKNTIYGSSGALAATISSRHTVPEGSEGSAMALDVLVGKFVSDFAPSAEFAVQFFAMLAGLCFLIIGIVRLTKSLQEGPRGPAGIGTLMTFIAAGALLSSWQMAGVFTSTLFGDHVSSTYAVISRDVISDVKDAERIAIVIESVMQFIALVGFIAFVRGWFVLKAFADGAQGASLAQGLTFLLGGVLAINLGDLINVLGRTLNLNGLAFI